MFENKPWKVKHVYNRSLVNTYRPLIACGSIKVIDLLFFVCVCVCDSQLVESL